MTTETAKTATRANARAKAKAKGTQKMAATVDAQTVLETVEGAALLATLEAFAKAACEPRKALTRGFGPQFDIYEPHRKTQRTEAREDGSVALVPHVAAKSRRAVTKANAKGDLGPSGANRRYRVVRAMHAGEAKPGTWRHVRLSAVLAHTDKHAAQVAYARDPWPDLRPLDDYCFAWAVRKGYIVWVD